MNLRLLLIVALGLVIVVTIGISISSLNKPISFGGVSHPQTELSRTAPTNNSPNSVPSSAPKVAQSAIQPGSVTVLPVPNVSPAPIVAPTSLPAGWNKSYTHYQYPGGATPDYKGLPITAFVDAGGQKIQLQPNQEGGFPCIFLDPKAKAQVILQFPQGTPGDRIGISAVDGGYLGSVDPVEVLTLNQEKAVLFQFTLSENQGITRVAVQDGVQTNLINFWAGPDNKYPQVASTKANSR